MRNLCIVIVLIIQLVTVASAFSSETTEIISLYKGSKLIFNDDIGYETHYFLSDETSVKTIDGEMNRRFCSVPEGISPLEIIKNYEHALKTKGGTIIHLSRNAYRHTNKDTGERVWFMRNLFTHGHIEHQHYGYLQMTREAEDYIVGKISQGGSDILISVASAVIEKVTYYEVVTVIAKPMDMNNVTLNVLNEGMSGNGKVAIYDIYFDTGKYQLKQESTAALKIIAKYLKENSDKQFLIVGHTDNVGAFDFNIKLSKNRALSVVNELISTYGINNKQLKAYGVGPAAPVTTNSTKEGKARNRRVELVEQ